MTTDEKLRGILDRFAYQYEKVVKTHGTTVKDIIPVYDKALTAIKEIMVERKEYASEDEINAILKSIEFKDFIPTNGVPKKDRYITMHNNARKRIAKALVGKLVKKPSVEQMEKLIDEWEGNEDGKLSNQDLAKFLVEKMGGR